MQTHEKCHQVKALRAHGATVASCDCDLASVKVKSSKWTEQCDWRQFQPLPSAAGMLCNKTTGSLAEGNFHSACDMQRYFNSINEAQTYIYIYKCIIEYKLI